MNIVSMWIKRIVNKLFLKKNRLNKNVLLEIAEKKAEFDKRENGITGIVLGSSHGAYGFDPTAAVTMGGGYFNLCSTSQDLYYSFQLYLYSKKYGFNCNKVILFFSVFTPGFDLSRTREKYIPAYYYAIYGIAPRCEFDGEFREQYNLCKKYLATHGVATKKLRGFYHRQEYFPAETERPLSHLKNNKREKDQFGYLETLWEDLKEKKGELFVVIPPARIDYRLALPPKEEMFVKLYNYAQEKGIKVLDFFDSNLFGTEDFGDTDHLTPLGAKKLTIEISKRLV